ncbi:hypothetical protein, partial [Weissella confusa]|uniref:hypothetical protein n=1 Tax=Weissella confusa TaxID=1583 RepID=UPI0022FE8892
VVSWLLLLGRRRINKKGEIMEDINYQIKYEEMKLLNIELTKALSATNTVLDSYLKLLKKED